MGLDDHFILCGIFMRTCLYDKTVVAEPDGVIEDSGKCGSNKVAQSKG